MPNLSEVNLNRLAVFVAVGDSASFTKAAAQLGLAKTMVSKHIQLLEAELGVTLMLRSTRKTSLTEAGRLFHAASREMLQAAEAAIDAIREGREAVRGKLRVTAPHDYGVLVVAPVLAALCQEHPALDAELLCEDHLSDLVAANIDVAIRLGKLADSSYRALCVGSFDRGLVASPAFIARNGLPADFAALMRLPFIAHAALPQPAAFSLQSAGAEAQSLRMSCVSFSSNTASACRAAVLAGAGVALMTDFSIQDDLTQGRLVRLFAHWRVAHAPIHAVYPVAAHPPLKVRLFIDALRGR